MVSLDIVVQLHLWQTILALIASTLSVGGTLYGIMRYSVRVVQAKIEAAAQALDARRHEDLVGMRSDILDAMDRITPGVGTFEDIKESELGHGDVTGYRSS